LDEIAFPFDDSTWIIADTHFFHANIGQYCDRPDGWQDLIIENWNRFIQPDDTVFHLGDLALGKKEDTEALIPLLNGKLYLIRGNHDRRGKAFYNKLGITLVPDPFRMVYSKKLRLVSRTDPLSPWNPVCSIYTATSIIILPQNWAHCISTLALRFVSIVPGA
jgi:calcineurin-like phosphoesterase family protein